MKNRKILITALLSVIIFTGCEDFLNVKSDYLKESSNSFQKIEDLKATTAYLYCAPWFMFNTNSYTVYESRANNLLSDNTNSAFFNYALYNIPSSQAGLGDLWNSLYMVVNQSNAIINDYVPKARMNNLDKTQVDACEGEARFMRGTAYWHLAMLWHDVPIIDDYNKYVLNTTIPPHCFEDVLNYATNDLDSAAKWLPKTDIVGRLTQYSAEAMLARLCLTAANYAMGNNFTPRYLTRNGVSSNSEMATLYLEKAKSLTDHVITSGTQYGIMDNFEDLWKIQNNNNKETLFGIQIIPRGDYGLGNSRQDNLAGSSTLTGGLNAWGGSNFAGYDIVKLLVDNKAMSRLRGSIFVAGEKYDYLATQTAAGSWTVTGTKCNIKKFVVGSDKDTEGVAINGNSGQVIPLIRMAEVYLMYTEAVMGIANQTSDAIALERFNKIRKRAFYINPLDYVEFTTITRDDMFKERRMEFFMELLFWPDIVRRSFYDLDWTTKFINNKLSIDDPATDLTNWQWYHYTLNDSGGSWTNSPRPTNPISVPNLAQHNMNGATYVHSIQAEDNIWGTPYPQTELINNPALNNEPINYNF